MFGSKGRLVQKVLRQKENSSPKKLFVQNFLVYRIFEPKNAGAKILIGPKKIFFKHLLIKN